MGKGSIQNLPQALFGGFSGWIGFVPLLIPPGNCNCGNFTLPSVSSHLPPHSVLTDPSLTERSRPPGAASHAMTITFNGLFN